MLIWLKTFAFALSIVESDKFMFHLLFQNLTCKCGENARKCIPLAREISFKY